jgi:putative SOS response-associated peptidase YedK
VALPLSTNNRFEAVHDVMISEFPPKATAVIPSTEANAEMRAVHDRMPVVTEPLTRPAADGTLRLRPVSRDVPPVTPRDEDEAGPDPA